MSKTWLSRIALIGTVYVLGACCETENEAKVTQTPDEPVPQVANASDVAPQSTHETHLFPICVDGKVGFINQKGEVVIEPRFDFSVSFSKGLAAVRMDNKYGYINKVGKVVIEPQFEWAGSFSEGLACMQQGKEHGFIDKTGRVVIQPQFDRVSFFSESMAAVKVGEKYGYVNKNGTLVIKPQFRRAGDFSEGLACVEVERKSGIIDKAGRFIVELQSDKRLLCVFSFSEGLMPVIVDKQCGFIDKSGVIAIEPQFDLVDSFHEGLAAIKVNDKYGYIDTTGKVVIEPQFEWTFYFSEGLAPVQVRGKWGYVDKRGNMVIEPQFDIANPFSDGLASIMIGSVSLSDNPSNWMNDLTRITAQGEHGYIDKSGEYVWGPQRFIPAALQDRFIKTAACRSALQHIGIALQIYSDDYDQHYPPDLRCLYNRYLPDIACYVCPLSGRKKAEGVTPTNYAAPTPVPANIPYVNISYCYVSGLKTTDPADYILAFDEEINHGGDAIHVLYIGQNIREEKSIYAIHSQLKKQEEELRAQGREMKVLRPSALAQPHPTDAEPANSAIEK